MIERKTVLENIEDKYNELFKRQKQVANYIREHPDKVIMMNVAELAAECGVSDATIVRMCQHVGYQGYHEMRLLLSRDVGREDDIQQKNENLDFIDYVMQESLEDLRNLSVQLDKEALISSVRLIMGADTVYISAIGNTTPVASDLEFRLARFGIRAYTASKSETLLNYVSLGSKRDVLIAISSSGESKRVIQGAEMAREIGMKIVAITGKKVSPLAQVADYVIVVGHKNKLFANVKEPVSHIGEIVVNDVILYAIKCLSKDSLVYKEKRAFINEVSEITSSEKM